MAYDLDYTCQLNLACRVIPLDSYRWIQHSKIMKFLDADIVNSNIIHDGNENKIVSYTSTAS